MADVFTKSKRSEVMRRVKSTNTKPEIIVRKFLYANGFRYRVHLKNVTGKPDITLKKYNTVIFVNGCFWHGHQSCGTYQMPKTNKKFWYEKIKKNIQRDEKNQAKLKELGWNVIVIWECQLKKKSKEFALHDLIENIINHKNLV